MATKEVELEAKLAEIQARIVAEEKKVDLLKKEVIDKEGKVGMTVEEQDRLAELDREIARAKAQIDTLLPKIAPLEKQVAAAQAKVTALTNELNAIPGKISDWEKKKEIAAKVIVKRDLQSSANREAARKAIDAFNSAWKGIAKITGVNGYFYDTRHLFYKVRHRSSTFAMTWTIGGKTYGTLNAHSWVDYEDKYHETWRQTVIGYADKQIASLKERMAQIRDRELPIAQSKLSDLSAQLNKLRSDYEYAQRRYNDAIAAKSRAELEIRRAIALRQAELDAAKARLEMEIRLLGQLKASEEMLRAQIEQARAEAVARAAREREALLKAQEEERRRIAEEQRRKAEQELAVAQAESMTAIAEREEVRKQAYIKAAKARAEAEEIAKQREEQAKLAARAEAAASVARLKAEETSRKVAVAKTMPSVAAEVKPTIPIWLIIGGLIALAGKKKE